MNKVLSAFERAQQILKSIELEERRNELKKTEINQNMHSRPQSDDELSGEGISMEAPVKKELETPYTQQQAAHQPLIRLDEQNIVQGFIFSEILGKPISRRRGRG